LEKWYNLGTLPEAIAAYKQRMGIEEMFRDCKTGGYNLESTGLIWGGVTTRLKP
jgi:hypothetical protein